MANEKDSKKKAIEYDDDYDVWYDDRPPEIRFASVSLEDKKKIAKDFGITLEELLSFA